MRILNAATTPKGTDVKQVQFFLIGRGLYKGAVDGIFGPRSAAAVVDYQRYKRLLPEDGIVGRLTWAAMIQDGLPIVVDNDRDVPHCPDDIKPLTNNEARMRRWGRFSYVPDPTDDDPEQIRITDDWEDKNIVPVNCPIWGPHHVRLHKAIVEDYLGFMQDVIAAGLRDRLLTFDGGFNARYIRGSRSTLSNHSWGTAFDVNCDDNLMGHTPAYIGEHGCVRELVMLGVKHSFFWGGWFTRMDGMHFEHV